MPKFRSSTYDCFLRLVNHLQSLPVPPSNTVFDDEWTKIVPRHQAMPDRPLGRSKTGSGNQRLLAEIGYMRSSQSHKVATTVS